MKTLNEFLLLSLDESSSNLDSEILNENYGNLNVIDPKLLPKNKVVNKSKTQPDGKIKNVFTLWNGVGKDSVVESTIISKVADITKIIKNAKAAFFIIKDPLTHTQIGSLFPLKTSDETISGFKIKLNSSRLVHSVTAASVLSDTEEFKSKLEDLHDSIFKAIGNYKSLTDVYAAHSVMLADDVSTNKTISLLRDLFNLLNLDKHGLTILTVYKDDIRQDKRIDRSKQKSGNIPRPNSETYNTYVRDLGRQLEEKLKQYKKSKAPILNDNKSISEANDFFEKYGFVTYINLFRNNNKYPYELYNSSSIDRCVEYKIENKSVNYNGQINYKLAIPFDELMDIENEYMALQKQIREDTTVSVEEKQKMMDKIKEQSLQRYITFTVIFNPSSSKFEVTEINNDF
jgi:hypothetical protein